MRALDDSAFSYATPAVNFINAIMAVFNRMIDELGKVP